MGRGTRVGAWLIGASVLITILLNCFGVVPRRNPAASTPPAPACPQTEETRTLACEPVQTGPTH